jgi:hypothetical protein
MNAYECYNLSINSLSLSGTNTSGTFTGAIAVTTGILTTSTIASNNLLQIGSIITGSNVPDNIMVIGYGTGSNLGIAGTYQTNCTIAVSSTTLTATFTSYPNSVILNQQTSGAQNRNSYRYLVNWDSILPSKYKYSKFLVLLSMRTQNALISTTTQADVTQPLQLVCNFGQTQTYEPNSQSNHLALIYPYQQMTVVAATTQAPATYYQCSYSDNVPFNTTYPTNAILQIDFQYLNSQLIAKMPDYVLNFSFIPLI